MCYRASIPHSKMIKVPLKPSDEFNPTLWDVFFKSEWDGTGLAKLRIFNDLSIRVLHDSVTVKAGA